MPSANTAKTKKKARQAPDPASGAATKSPLPAVAERLPEPPGVLAGLGLQGWERVEHAVLASLVSEDPLLLIGLHGTGKSMLLERLAGALHLTFRHYNASLICFDDLIGFPVPEPGSTTLKYLQTPATIWDAEVADHLRSGRWRHPDRRPRNELIPRPSGAAGAGPPLDGSAIPGASAAAARMGD